MVHKSHAQFDVSEGPHTIIEPTLFVVRLRGQAQPPPTSCHRKQQMPTVDNTWPRYATGVASRSYQPGGGEELVRARPPLRGASPLGLS